MQSHYNNNNNQVIIIKQPQQHILFHDLPPNEVQHGDHLRVSRIKGVYWHHGFACQFKYLKKYIDVVNKMRERRKKEPLPECKDNDIVIVEQNRDPDGLCVVTISEFSMGVTLRIVKFNVSAFENAIKVSGSTYTQRAIPVDESTDRAIEELLEQNRLELDDPTSTQWKYHVAGRNCETFVLYCKGIIAKEEQYSDQVSAALVFFKSVGALTINRSMTSTMGMIGRLKSATMQIYVFARSVAVGGTAKNASQIAAGVSNICTHLVACGIGTVIQFGIEVTVNVVRWLLRLWDKHHWLSFSTKTFFQEMLKSISRCAFSFVGSLLGMFAGAPGGPLAIVTAVLGSVLASYFGHKAMGMFLAWRSRKLLDLEDEEAHKLLEISRKEDLVVFHDLIENEDVCLHKIVEDDWVLI